MHAREAFAQEVRELAYEASCLAKTLRRGRE